MKTSTAPTAASLTRLGFCSGTAATLLLASLGCSKAEDKADVKARKEKTGMDFNELIEARRSVRQYAKSEIAPKEMEAIVADALNAPSWKNSETTRYHAAVGEAAKKRMWEEALPGFNAASSANAAALVAVTFVPGESGHIDGKPSDALGDSWGAYDCGLVSAYFVLAAKNHGWDTLIMGIRNEAKVKEILSIPEKEILMSVIAVGKSAQKYRKVPRKPVSEVLKIS